jgi:hypothetical protein
MKRPSSLAASAFNRHVAPAVAILSLLVATPAALRADDARPDQLFARQATWKAPTAAAVREQLRALLAEQKTDEALRTQIETDWSPADQWSDSGAIFDHLVASLASADPRAREIVELCSKERVRVALPSIDWLVEETTPALERNNLRLLYGRWLVQEKLIDESLAQLEALQPDQVADPAGLLFYQAVVYHQMLNKKPGLDAIARLLEREKEIPRRYVSVAKLMQADLEPLKDDSLDHIARRMDDVRRRLDLGRAGPKVREVEDGVIKSLDKLIEEMEKQAQEMAAKSAGGGGSQGSIRSSSPAPDSMPLTGKGPGNVTKKDIGHQSGWGELPPKDRQEALQQIGKDFPAHYRDVIEQYFRKLASEDSEK